MGVLGWSLTVVGLLIGLVSLCTLIGAFLPRDHVASRQLTLARPPAEVAGLISDAVRWPSWWKLLKAVERLPDRDGKPAFRLLYQDGNRFDLVLEEAGPSRIVTRIDDVRKLFGGTWTWDIQPAGAGCQVRLTENGSIPNPFIRFMARMMMDNAMYIDIHLKAVAEHFGEAGATVSP